METYNDSKIEFYFWDCNALNSILNHYKSAENLLNQGNVNQVIIENLTQKGFAQDEAEKYVEMTKNKLIEDLKLYLEIKNVENCNYKFETEFIEDKWNDNSPKKYKLIVK